MGVSIARAGKWECTPLVVDGVLYISERPNIVTVLGWQTGRTLWNYRRGMAENVRGCCGPVNRGLAVLGDALYLCTYDCHLVCIDANTGHERWDTVVADYKTGYSMTVAPLAVKDKIIVGISGAEFGVRGFIDAYDAKTGKQAWRFWTIPAPGEPGNETWGGSDDAWKRGGGADVGHRHLRSGSQPALLGHRQPRPRLQRRCSSRRQSLHLLRRGDRRRQRQAANGISSTRLTTRTTGIRMRCRSCSTQRSMASRASCSHRRIATRSSIAWIARPANSSPASRSRNKPGPRDSTKKASPSSFPIKNRPRRACRSIRAWKAR